MDPISIIGSGLTIIALCDQIYRVLRATIETYKDCPIELNHLSTRAGGLLLQLRRLDAVKSTLSSDRRKYLSMSCGEDQCMKTVVELNKLVWEIRNAGIGQHEKAGYRLLADKPISDEILSGEAASSPSFFGRLKWFFRKDYAAKLLDELKEHQQQIFMAVSTIAMEASLGAEKNTNILIQDRASLERLSQKVLNSTVIKPAFHTPVVPHRRQEVPQSQQTSQAVLTWYGALSTRAESYYAQERYKFSTAAYSGKWGELFNILGKTRTQLCQNWVNCIRLSLYDQLGEKPSGYTPLHQAAWHGAPVQVVEKLLRLGAWRTIRSIRSGDNTPLDIAKRHRWDHLYGILSPVIRHPVPPRILLALQNALYEIIEHEIRAANIEKVSQTTTRYPDLSVLTEMVDPIIYFPIDEEVQERGFYIRLDDRELLVQSCHHNRKFRISEEGETRQVEEAFILNL